MNLSHNKSTTETVDTVTNCTKEDIVEKAKKQLGTAFGCLPLSTIKLFTGKLTYCDKIPDIIQTHRLVRQSGVPLDFDRAGTLGQILDNHISANEYPDQVD